MTATKNGTENKTDGGTGSNPVVRREVLYTQVLARELTKLNAKMAEERAITAEREAVREKRRNAVSSIEGDIAALEEKVKALQASTETKVSKWVEKAKALRAEADSKGKLIEASLSADKAKESDVQAQIDGLTGLLDEVGKMGGTAVRVTRQDGNTELRPDSV